MDQDVDNQTHSIDRRSDRYVTEQADFMQRATIRDCDLVPWGSNYTFGVLLEDPDGVVEEQIAIYKPAAGEIPLWDFPDDTLFRREYCAFLVSQALRWNFIPTTIIRDGPHGIGSVQDYIEPVEDQHYFTLRDSYQEEMKEIAIFDVITNNADRKAGHCLLGSSDNQIWGIDHGLTFNVESKLRTVIWDFQLEKLDADQRKNLNRIVNDADLLEELSQHLTPNEIRAFKLRSQRLAKEVCFLHYRVVGAFLGVGNCPQGHLDELICQNT